MQRILFSTILIIGCLSLSNCSNGTSEKLETDNTKNDTLPKKELIRAVCSDEETPNPDLGPPILTKTCVYKNYKLVSTGYPDYKGRYSYEFTVYAKQADSSYQLTRNGSLFNEKQDELVLLINDKIKRDYEQFLNDPESQDCLSGYSYRTYSLDELGMTIGDEGFNFNVYFGLSGACMAVDGTTISLSWEEMDKYL